MEKKTSSGTTVVPQRVTDTISGRVTDTISGRVKMGCLTWVGSTSDVELECALVVE